jgi:polyisoprenyl-phosphate glycosyltransferase
MCRLSIVVPFYNEAMNVRAVLEQFHRFWNQYQFELICVNGASTDETDSTFRDLLSQEGFGFVKYISCDRNEGYGQAIMTGVRAASGDVIAWTHSDLQTPVDDVFRAYELYCRKPALTIVKGWRVNRTLGQQALSWGMAIVASIILRRRLFEINAQPKLFPRTLVTLLQHAPSDFSLDLYLLCIAQDHGYLMETIRVRFPNRLYGQSSWAFSWRSRWKTILRTFRYIWRLRSELRGNRAGRASAL